MANILPAPLGLRYTINSLGKVVLNWYPVSGVNGYNVYKRTSATGTFGLPLNSVPVTAFTFTDINYNNALDTYYSVTAVVT